MGMPGSMLQNQSVNGNLSLIMDVPLNVSVEIGKTRRRLKDVLNFSNGTVVELDKQSDALWTSLSTDSSLPGEKWL